MLRRRLNESNISLLSTVPTFKKYLTPKVNQKLEMVAKELSYAIDKRGGLQTMRNDEDDFIEVAVWNIKSMLQEAYLMGLLSKDKID